MMKRFFFMIAILLLAGKGPGTADAADATGTIAIRVNAATVTNGQIEGAGWNVGPLWIPDKAQAPGDYDKFFALMRYSRQSYIRVITQFYEWEGHMADGKFVPGNDDGDPWTPPSQIFAGHGAGFAWNDAAGIDPRLLTLLDFCEANGIDVEINNWEAELKSWLRTKQYADPDFYKTPVAYADYLRDAEEFGENVASLVYYLKTLANGGKGYDCVKYYAVWNEPGGGHTDHTLVHVDYPGSLNLLHKTVREHLAFYDKQMGTDVLARIQCMGLESYPFWRNSPDSGHKAEDWNELLGKGVIQYLEKPDGLPGEITLWPSGDPSMDAISLHNYWGVFDYDSNNPSSNNHGTIDKQILGDWVRGGQKQIRDYDIDGQIEPFFFNELGCYTYIDTPAGASAEESAPSYDQSLMVVETAVRALAIPGVEGVSRWAWNMHKGFAAVSYPGCWWEVDPKGRVKTLDANFYPYTLLTRHLPKGSKALETTVEGGADASRGKETWPIVETPRVFATAFQSPGGQMQLFIVNDSYEPKTCRVELQGLEADEPVKLRHLFVTALKYDRINEEGAPVAAGQNAFTVEIAPRSVNVLTQGTPHDGDTPPWEFLK